MDSREFGLVAFQQLFQMEDLHYGFWDEANTATLGNFLEAQKRHTSFLFEHLDASINSDKQLKLLDAGCGVGVTTSKLLASGYKVDGLVPSNWMALQATKICAPFKNDSKGTIFENIFEDYPESQLKEKYQTVFFSESYQYVNMQKGFDKLNAILADNGSVVIFDFFKKDGVEGKSPLGGGHSLNAFYKCVEKNGFSIAKDLDVTNNLSPNMKLVNELLVDRILPFSHSFGQFFSTRYPKSYKLFNFLFRKKLAKIRFKYSNKRDENSFKKFKTYRLIVLKRN